MYHARTICQTLQWQLLQFWFIFLTGHWSDLDYQSYHLSYSCAAVLNWHLTITEIFDVPYQSYFPDVVDQFLLFYHLDSFAQCLTPLPILQSVPLLCSCSELTSHNNWNIWCVMLELSARYCWPVYTILAQLLNDHLLAIVGSSSIILVSWIHSTISVHDFDLCQASLNWTRCKVI